MPVKNGSETAGDGHSVESSQKSPTFVFDSIDAVDGVTEGSPPKPDSSAHCTWALFPSLYYPRP